MQGITIKRKHFLSIATPSFDEDIHSSGTVKGNKTSNQYFIEVLKMHIGRIEQQSQILGRQGCSREHLSPKAT